MAFIIVYFVRLIINALNTPYHARLVHILLIISVCAFVSGLFSTATRAFEPGQSADNSIIDFKLSPSIKEAVDNGIIITFECKLKTNKSIGFIAWPSQVQHHTFVLKQHLLSNRYLVHIDYIETPKIFPTIGEATDFITESSVNFFTQYSIAKKDTQMRLFLNKFKLPGPIRLNAFIADHWDIDTGWISWSSEI